MPLSGLLSSISLDPSGRLESIQFPGTAPRSILDLGVRITLDSGVITFADCSIEQLASDQWRASYRNHVVGLDLHLRYEAVASGGFVRKHLTVVNRGSRRHLIQRIDLWDLHFTPAFQQSLPLFDPAAHPCPLGLSLRDAEQGLSVGLEHPFFRMSVDPGHCQIWYEPNAWLAPEESLACEAGFMGRWRPSGKLRALATLNGEEDAADEAELAALAEYLRRIGPVWRREPFGSRDENGSENGGERASASSIFPNAPVAGGEPDPRILELNGARLGTACWADARQGERFLAECLERLSQGGPRAIRFIDGWFDGRFSPAGEDGSAAGVPREPHPDCYDPEHAHPRGVCRYLAWRNVARVLGELKRRHPDCRFEFAGGNRRLGPWLTGELTLGEGAAETPAGALSEADRSIYMFVPHDHMLDEDSLLETAEGGIAAKTAVVSVDVLIWEDGGGRFQESIRSFDGWYDRAVRNLREVRNRIDAHPERLQLVLRGEDFEKARRDGRSAIVLGFEGGKPLEGSLEKLRDLFERGLRQLQFTWAFRNQLADAQDETEDNGLTPFGREVVREINRLGIVGDMTHISKRAFREVMELSDDPIIASHSSGFGFCPDPGNLDDDQLRMIAQKGGVAGVHFASHVVKWPNTLATIEDVVDHACYMIDVAGIDHVGLGVDFFPVDEPYRESQKVFLNEVDPRGRERLDLFTFVKGMDRFSRLRTLIPYLRLRGFHDDEIRKLMGGNWLRVYRQILP
ncbi:MAG TPA: membrane dipeptidase [Candidatus Sumerlaeota bacterium]|nr:membrane dipeptidase [Candidatus Sumerlaeota bacterium]